MPEALIFGQPGGHSVPISIQEDESTKSIINHVFISRYVDQVLKIKGLFEVFRVHLVMSPDLQDKKYINGELIMTYQPNKPVWAHYSFEHIGGNYIVEPYPLINDIIINKKEIIADGKIDLIPERVEYTKKPPFLPHPGLFNLEFGVAAIMENEEVAKHKKAILVN